LWGVLMVAACSILAYSLRASFSFWAISLSSCFYCLICALCSSLTFAYSSLSFCYSSLILLISSRTT
jgi:hypothetical protein